MLSNVIGIKSSNLVSNMNEGVKAKISSTNCWISSKNQSENMVQKYWRQCLKCIGVSIENNHEKEVKRKTKFEKCEIIIKLIGIFFGEHLL